VSPWIRRGDFVKQPSSIRGNQPTLAEFVITGALLVTFSSAYLISSDWPSDSYIFPRIVTVLGVTLALLRLGQLTVASVRAGRERRGAEVSTALGQGSGETSGEDDDPDAALQYAFSTASPREWISALSWVAAYLLALVLLGFYVAAILVSFAYPYLVGKVGFRRAVTYAVIVGALLWALLDKYLQLGMPTSVIF
jgi:hypothetical protein